MIRIVKDTDIDQLVILEKELFPEEPWSEDAFIHEINDNPFSYIYVYEENNEIIGYIVLWIAYENADIANIGVSKKAQCKGIGSKLMEHCIALVKEKRCQNMSLEVRVSNASAIHLYEKYGFKNVAKRKHYYADGEDAYLMDKEMEKDYDNVISTGK